MQSRSAALSAKCNWIKETQIHSSPRCMCGAGSPHCQNTNISLAKNSLYCSFHCSWIRQRGYSFPIVAIFFAFFGGWWSHCSNPANWRPAWPLPEAPLVFRCPWRGLWPWRAKPAMDCAYYLELHHNGTKLTTDLCKLQWTQPTAIPSTLQSPQRGVRSNELE